MKTKHKYSSLLGVFEIEQKELGNLPDKENGFEDIRQQLRKRIAELIDRNLEKLKWILYRIDVPEQKLMETLANHPANEAPEIITDMIIAREQEKAKTRKQYRSKGDPEGIEFLDL